ncbi:MAG: 16S rRNA (adenine(1518)-N(6)/adenine(1519)-N(6))-dimethyltransferase RsmA [Clostridia bacterium]|nr:16S rRNA (adenine(1518)-N(6)/adenine(1519)-N(6))-dimethyltransferase RsmA [Clostridia bacterium]
MNLIAETDFLLKKYNLKAKKSLGQNFLISEEIVCGIAEVAEVTKEDTIIEIGPGLGTLTSKLAECAKEVIAIELDDDMIRVLTERFSLYDNVKLIHADVLKTDLKGLIADKTSVKVVANLPYYITTPIVMKLLEDDLKIEQITVMVQKEVGERFTATPNGKEYGAITVSINYYTEPSIALDVPRDNFDPVPDVDSCVVNLKVRKERAKLKNEKNFFRVIKAAFSQRRKNIANSLMGVGKSKQEVKEMLDALGLDSNLRAENLSLETFVKIADYIS